MAVAQPVRRGLVVGEVGRGTFVRAPEMLRAASVNDAAIYSWLSR